MERFTDAHPGMINEVEEYTILLVDGKGNIESRNKGPENITGNKPDEIIGRNFRVFYTAEDQEKGLPEKMINDATANGKTIFEGWSLNENGTKFWGNIITTALYNKEGNLTGFSIVTRDMTVKNQPDELYKLIASKELVFQNEEKEKRAAELIIASKELVFQNEEKEKRAAELIIANKELVFQNDEKENRAAELIIANKELNFQNEEKEKRAAELIIANKELAFQNEEKEKRAAELIIANEELVFQNEEKEKRAAELIIANKELVFQNDEKEKRAAELIIANKELVFQNEEKEKRAAELIIANNELVFQNEEKENRAAELIIANKELNFQNEEKENRAEELIIANIELNFQNEEKEKRAAELFIANKELVFQNEEKEKRAAELIIANKELAFQNVEKENRAAELIIANKELVFQNEERKKRAAELIVANKELYFQNEEKENRAAELIIANKELAFQNVEKEKRAAELINANRLYAFLSQINQTIVHFKNEQTVFKEVCHIAIELGKFKVAWIGKIDAENKKLSLIEEYGMLRRDISLLTDIIYDTNDPHGQVIHSGNSFICNDIANDPVPLHWKLLASDRGWGASMVLPIKKSGKVVAIFNIISSEKNFFNAVEIALLEEAANDISFALDVFEKEKRRMQMEGEVMHNELRLKQAESIAHYGNWELDFSTGVGVWSDEACRIYGFDPSENIQSYQSWLSFIHPEDLDYVMKVTKAEQEMLSNTAFHYRIIRRDGTVRHIFSQAHFEFNRKGKPIGLYSVVHDVTETKEAEEALAQSESNLRQIMDLIPQSISAKDYTGKYVFINNSFAALYGLTPNELINKSILETIPVTSESEYFLRQDQEVILSGETKIIPEDIFTDHKGDTRLFYTVKVPFTVAGTNEKAVLGISMDVTEQKQADAERTKMIADIVQRNKDLEQFSYIISHNLRAPVANILGLTEVIELPGLSEEDEKELMGSLSVSVKKLDNVIMDLNYILQVKNTESKKKELVRFSEILRDIKISIDNLIKNDDVQILCDFSAVDEIHTVNSYLYSVIFNLISNSIKYRRSEIKPIIEITSARLNDKIQIIFKDNGLGIDLEKRGGQVFGLYKRFHDHVDGKGMGLFMVKTQVESLGGNISISSEVNKGTEFRIEFGSN